MTTTRRIQYHQYGGPEVMRLESFDLPAPAAGEVLVRVHAAAANPMDWQIRSGELKLITGRRFPRGLGHDFAGVVEAVGDGVTRLGVGDRVLGAASVKSSGAFAELVVAEAKSVVRMPDGLSFVDAAALPIAGLTGYQAIVTVGRLQAGQSVFIAGCLGAVGRAATQFALAAGVSVAGSCRAATTAKLDGRLDPAAEARELGVDPVVGFDFDPATLNRRFDVVFDTAGALPSRVSRALVKPGGRIIDIKPTPAKFVRSVLPGAYRVLVASTGADELERVAQAAGEGTLRLPIAATVPLEEAIPALAELERSRATRGGKVIVTP